MFLSLSLILSHSLLYADDNQDLNEILEEVTTVATKTKLNADYVPGTVTVISGEKLKSLGINNLAEQNAFDMIVGFDSSTLSLRGAGSIYGSQGNKIKWMINAFVGVLAYAFGRITASPSFIVERGLSLAAIYSSMLPCQLTWSGVIGRSA